MNHAEYLAAHAPEQSLPNYGKSFSLAAKLLPKKNRFAVTELYAFCRAVDDIADETKDLEYARSRLNQLQTALGNRDKNDALAARYIGLVERHDLSISVAQRFIQSILADCNPVRIEHDEALIRYCFGVAGTVGLMMCPLLGVSSKTVYVNAAALGIGMQMTNIARDVIEDAGRARCYIPANYFTDQVDLEDIANADARAVEKIFPAIEQLLLDAEPWYQLGAEGFSTIPFGTRLSIRAASKLYHKIGDRILAMSVSDYAKQRVVTSKWQKFTAVVSAIKQPEIKLSASALAVVHSELQSLGIS
jgi:15-cis-phytoene synthase